MTLNWQNLHLAESLIGSRITLINYNSHRTHKILLNSVRIDEDGVWFVDHKGRDWHWSYGIEELEYA